MGPLMTILAMPHPLTQQLKALTPLSSNSLVLSNNFDLHADMAAQSPQQRNKHLQQDALQLSSLVSGHLSHFTTDCPEPRLLFPFSSASVFFPPGNCSPMQSLA